MNDESLFCRNSEYICRDIAGEHVLIPTGKAAIKFNGMASLNKTAFFLWNLLGSEKKKSELADGLSREYGISSEQSLEDVNEFLDMALERGLILQC